MADVESAWDALFGLLAQSEVQIAMVATGGGTGAIARCFGRPGASRNFVEAVIPYSRKSLADYLGSDPRGSSASSARAVQLASTAHARAKSMHDCEGTRPAAGVALVAALPTIPRRRGRDRIHVASESAEHRVGWSLEMTAGDFDRAAAERLCDRMLLLALSDLIGLPGGTLSGGTAQELREDYAASSIELTRSER